MLLRKSKILIIAIVAVMFSYYAYIFMGAKSSGKKLYQITVYDGYNKEVFFSSEIYSNTGKCIVFLNLFNQKTTQCAQNIGVVEIN